MLKGNRYAGPPLTSPSHAGVPLQDPGQRGMTGHPGGDGDRPALEDFAHFVRGAAQLLDSVSHSSTTPKNLRAGLDLLSTSLHQTADKASALIDEIGIDLTEQLGITTSDLARMNFTAVTPAFQRQPRSLSDWTARAEAEFTLWGAVEAILSENDTGLERRFTANTDEHLALVDALEKLRERWQSEVKLLEATLLRLAVVVARWEQSGST